MLEFSRLWRVCTWQRTLLLLRAMGVYAGQTIVFHRQKGHQIEVVLGAAVF